MPSILVRPLGAAVAAAALAVSSASAQTPAGWSPVFTEEFETFRPAFWEALNRRDSFNNEKQHYHPAQVSASGGSLKLTATNVPLDGKPYRSGLVRTWAERTYGRWEIRAALPTGQGMWPAIWLLPRNADWPIGGEIDIMENRGSQPNLVSSAYHFGPSIAGHQYISRDFTNTVNGTPVSFHNQMHDYAVEWDAARIRYFVDDVPTFTFYRAAGRPISSTPMSLILNLAVGGDFGGDPNASTGFPQVMSVDHVRTYARNATTAAVANPSFEAKAGSLFAGWDEFSEGHNVVPDSVAAHARTGATAAQLWGRFNGTSDNTSGLYQELPTVPGEVWQAGAFARNRPGDKLVGGNTARVKIEFVDEYGNVISAGQLGMVDASSPTAYREGVVRRTAPAGAKFARAVLEMRQVNSAGGAVNFDDASLRRFTSAALAGDVNLDGARDAADLDALLHSLAPDNVAFDYNGDATVNGTDVDALLASAFQTVRGDADLDRRVDFNDLVVIAQRYGETDAGSWALGDFTGESAVGFDDLVLVAQHYGFGTAGRVSASAFTGDWQRALTMVPEPTGMAALAVAALAAGARRR